MYGIQVLNGKGKLENLADRPVMIAELFEVPYGVNGSKTIPAAISAVSVVCNYDIDPASDGKFIKTTFSRNTVSWEWVSAKGITEAPAKVIIMTGGDSE